MQRLWGDSLELSTIEKMALKQAALLHEAGLLFIPGSVSAKKREELTEYERDLFRQAPATVCSVFKPVSRALKGPLKSSVISMKMSMDRADPMGLKRRYIPLTARVLAGADLLDDLANGLANGWAERPGPEEKRPLPDALPACSSNFPAQGLIQG